VERLEALLGGVVSLSPSIRTGDSDINIRMTSERAAALRLERPLMRRCCPSTRVQPFVHAGPQPAKPAGFGYRGTESLLVLSRGRSYPHPTVGEQADAGDVERRGDVGESGQCFKLTVTLATEVSPPRRTHVVDYRALE